MKCFPSSEGNVWKYVFDYPDGKIAEAVLYRYNSFEERTVLCISVQSGCAVGCTFCGTGDKFVGNLTESQITSQVHQVLSHQMIDPRDCKKFQIMLMSMGEPFHNYANVSQALRILNLGFPNAQLLVSTIAPKRTTELFDFLELSQQIPQIGLQFSIHASTDEKRNQLIPFNNKLSLRQLRDYGILWWWNTERHPYCNVCVTDDMTKDDAEELMKVFPPIFYFTFSVVCSRDETMKDAGYRNLDRIREFEQIFIDNGYDTRIFDPAGQDDIGGGCGQLFHYQRKLKEKELCSTSSSST